MSAGLENPELGGKLIELGVMLLALLGILWGVVQCFLGYRIIRIVLGFYGFIWGLGAGVVLSLSLSIAGPAAIAVVVVCGAAGAVLMVMALYVGIFLLGATLAGGAAHLAAPALLGNAGISAGRAVVVIAGVAGGVVGLLFRRFIIIVLTSLGGAAQVVTGALLVMGDPVTRALGHGGEGRPPLTEILGGRHLVALACWAGLSLAGIVVQYSSAGGREAVRNRDKNLDSLLGHAKADE